MYEALADQINDVQYEILTAMGKLQDAINDADKNFCYNTAENLRRELRILNSVDINLRKIRTGK